MKKLLAAGVMLALVVTLAGCGKLSFSSDATDSSSGTATSKYQTTGTVDSSMYQGVIKNGRYQTSSARGLTITTNTQGSNTYNIKSMESGLKSISMTHFSTSKYDLEEGQLISTATAENWLARQSSSNPDGLNPAKGSGADYQTKRPEYLATLLEQDYMVANGNSLKLGGISIALGMNEYYYYQKKAYGATYSTHIDTPTLNKAGRAMAAKVVARLRKMKGVSNDTPIVVALYKNADQDALVGGTFFSSVTSKSGTQLGDWKTINEQNQVLPVVENEKALNTTVANDFSNFSDQIENFFPTLAGVTAQTHYESGQLTGMNITVNTQFYGQTEIESFTQYVASSAQKYLPSGSKIEITIQSTSGIQAFVARESGEKSFYTHVFGSY
ncbi:CamS family sex pheromone protein [Lacticaseibacillus baoqingensis]|uniref:CamS family sex pheromone protein n=1 Tax=Lacticaseibacillus baoqingensis TaxID=2486013 RepID=A0ABW4E4B4_9LACO|nr:CamS family sex pheromone protein [Lacticaseibacillus baoqingensis]